MIALIFAAYVLLLLFCWSLCRIAALADRDMPRVIEESRSSDV